MSQPGVRAEKPPLNEDNFRDWLAFLIPSPEELAYSRIGFLSSLWEGVLEADRLLRPILLWAMNGHPMACT